MVPVCFALLFDGIWLPTHTRHRGQGKDRMRQDLNSVQAYQSIFKHIRSVSQVNMCAGVSYLYVLDMT